MRQLILACCLLLPISHVAADILIKNATVRQPLPGKTVSAGYFSIENTKAVANALVKVESPWFGHIELHQHQMQNGMMQMVKMSRIDIGAEQIVHLQPGGLHLMLFKPTQTLSLTDEVPLLLYFADGSTLEVKASVTQIPTR